VTTAIARKAQEILGEDVGTDNHANRLVWANAVISGEKTKAEADKFMWPIIGLGTINGASTDNDILWAVAQFVNMFATG